MVLTTATTLAGQMLVTHIKQSVQLNQGHELHDTGTDFGYRVSHDINCQIIPLSF